MSKADEYYARAAQCKIRAKENSDPDSKLEFERLAEKWNNLAIHEDGRSLLNAPNQRPSVPKSEGVVRPNAEPGDNEAGASR